MRRSRIVYRENEFRQSIRRIRSVSSRGSKSCYHCDIVHSAFRQSSAMTKLVLDQIKRYPHLHCFSVCTSAYISILVHVACHQFHRGWRKPFSLISSMVGTVQSSTSSCCWILLSNSDVGAGGGRALVTGGLFIFLRPACPLFVDGDSSLFRTAHHPTLPQSLKWDVSRVYQRCRRLRLITSNLLR